MQFKLRAPEAWFEAALAGIVPTTTEAEELIGYLERFMEPVVVMEPETPEEEEALTRRAVSVATPPHVSYRQHRYDKRKPRTTVNEVVSTYERTGGNVSATARVLNTSRDTVRKMLRKQQG